MKFLELFVSCMVLWIFSFRMGIILFEKKNNLRLIKKFMNIFIFSAILMIVNLYVSNIVGGIIKIIISYALFCLYLKILFNQENSKIMVGGFIIYLSILISEIVIAIILSIIFELNNYDSMLWIKNTITINLLICSTGYFIITSTKVKLISLINNNRLNDTSIIIIILIMLLTIALLGFKIPLENWKFNLEFLITMIILLSLCIIGIFIIKQRADIQKTKSMYQQLVEYSNITNNVLEEYRMVTHEHNNQLLIIRSMLENKDKDIDDYVDNLLEKREGIKYKWVGELNHLPLSGLKGLINYKVLEMESLKLNKVISISNEVSKLKLEKLSMSEKDNLYSIIGVFLDNAIQAAKESKEKEVDIEIYKEKKEMVIIIANTYSGKIEMAKLDNYGYTTKGQKHGIGLHIVKNILNNETIFNSKTYLLDNYFVQEIRIDLKQIKAK